MLSAMGRMMGGGGNDANASKGRDEIVDTLCDVATRLQLLVLQECERSTVVKENGGFDPGRQLHELLLCGACWCEKPLDAYAPLIRDPALGSTLVGSLQPNHLVIQQQLGQAMARLMQAWPGAQQQKPMAPAAATSNPFEAAEPPSAAGIVAAPAPSAAAIDSISAIAPIVHGLLKLSASREEKDNILALHMETTAGSKSVQRFIETWQTWRVMLLREPFVTALRVLEQADNPAKIAMERWAMRQRSLVAVEDRTQREHRAMVERMQADTSAAFKLLATEVAPRVAVARSVTARSRAASAQQWSWTRYRLREDDPIWGVRKPSSGGASGDGEAADATPAEPVVRSSSPSLGVLSEGGEIVTPRLCEWLDTRSRHLLIVPNVQQPPSSASTSSTTSTTTSKPERTEKESNESESTNNPSSDNKLVKMGIKLPRLLSLTCVDSKARR